MARLVSILGALGLFLTSAPLAPAAEPSLSLKKGDHVVLIGNTLAEREQHFGRIETLLHSRFPDLELVVRNLGWSADELTLRPRSASFANHGHSLAGHQADVVLAFFGFNESFAGEAGLPKFKNDLTKFVEEQKKAKYNGESAPQVVLVSPIAHENLHDPNLPDGEATNKNLALYTQAMAEVAKEQGVLFVDLFHPSQKLYAAAQQPLTINGVHLNDEGYRQLAPVFDEALFGPRPTAQAGAPDLEKLRAEILEKNLQFWYDHRAVNGFYIYGGRKNPFGVVNFPAEFAKLRKMIANRDARVWAVAQGKSVPAEIDDSNTGPLPQIPTNFKQPIKFATPEEAEKNFELAKGYEVNCFANERDFPDLQNPVQMAWDARGRLWVATMPSYPQYNPGTPVNDKILILEDTTGDGRADKCTTFADGLHIPTGLELADGGVYVAQQPNLVFLKDTDGDDKADVKQIVLHGFDSADSHHSISAFVMGPGGDLYFQEGTFHHTQVETPYGPQRCANAGVFRYEPRTEKFEVFVSYGFANPWGHTFDRWGQNYVADASGGANYFGAAFSGSIDYPAKHSGLKQFLVKQWRPTAGCELVSSRNFPDDVQGNYLLNNCIGFQGVLQYKMKDDGSGVSAAPAEPLLKTNDRNFRPVDLEFGPDGALYVVDWFNPLVGHMQHSLRDPNRDKAHGRIWRVTYKDRPLVKPLKIAGEPVPVLLELLKTYADRDRYRVRRELGERNTQEVMAALDKWVAGLDKKDPDYEHHLLEALWLKQNHNVADEALLKRVLTSPDFRARAAATRVLCYWRDQVKAPLALLQTQVHDDNPRVRLEAVRALSFFRGADAAPALQIAMESLVYDQDDYLTYTLKETNRALEARIKQLPDSAKVAANPTGGLLKLLQAGRVPTERVPQFAVMICQGGGPSELAAIFEMVLNDQKLSAAARLEVLTALADAAHTRRVAPQGDVSGLEKLLQSPDGATQVAALRLAGLWKAKTLLDRLQQIALDEKAPQAARQEAIEALRAIGDQGSVAVLTELTGEKHPFAVRATAIGALAQKDLKGSAQKGAAILAASQEGDDLAPLLASFLDLKGGSDQLGAAIAAQRPGKDTAKLALRYLYASGRTDAALVQALSDAAGISANAAPPTAEEISSLMAEVQEHGDPRRGEEVFRRGDLSCMKCHAVSKAGGDIGPDLSPVGANSPVDFLIRSVLNPSQDIKEAYLTKMIITAQGKQYQGIVVDRDDRRVILKDANGVEVTIPTVQIDEEFEGRSLMPGGLANFMTRKELVDLVAFLSKLGQPGEYAIRSKETVQRWRVLKNPSPTLLEGIPIASRVRGEVLQKPETAWEPFYAKTGGLLPLKELKGPVVFLKGEVQMTLGGPMAVRFNSPEGVHLWIDGAPFDDLAKVHTSLKEGRHTILLRIDLAERNGEDLSVELYRPDGLAPQFEAVGGK